ncbi:Twinfilin-1 [Coniosporium apollinis]|uniref:Twinfilin-1 n=1 Tax=Coniosporium apollinis TaxID=61459 RepID=A0ABQ9NTR4_9PEZI|nr:Twinfilin-1 [Coniosporium apollinis]
MQSGITASPELHTAFQTLLSSPTQRGLLASISNETLVPITTIPSTSSNFTADLANLAPHLKPDAALYILLRRSPSTTSSPSSATATFVAITYIPDRAPVRQKTLFASTRLTLLRELGSENFGESLFVTEAEELSEAGWKRHEAHGNAERPLTEEERNLEGIKEAEAREAGGTGGRKRVGGGHLQINVGDGVEEAVRGLGEEGEGDNLVVLKIDIPTETLYLDSTTTATPSTLSSSISSTEPRYSFYRHPAPDSSSPILFIYTCPPSSKIKDRMIYAATKNAVTVLAEKDWGLPIARKLEASEPEEISAESIEAEFRPKEEVKSGFARPKRPGRR